MKIRLLLLTLLLSGAGKSVAQQHFPFPDSNAVWSIYEYKYSVQGDTFCNSHVYKKIFQDRDSIYYPGSGYYYCMVREDSLTHRIYGDVANNFTGSELLMYDFSLGVDDTVTVYAHSFWLWMCYPAAITIQVINIDSVYLAGQYRKRLQVDGYAMSSNYPEYWIEGIGSTFGLMYPGLSGYIAWEVAYPDLICFEQDGNVVYHNPGFPGCWAPNPVGIQDNTDENLIRMYPNPATDVIKINSPEIIQAFQIFSASGFMMEQKETNNSYITLDLTTYQIGVYFISLQVGQRMIHRKIVKGN